MFSLGGYNTNPDDAVFEQQYTSMGSYVMRHNAEICCEAFDFEGNVFQVNTCH